MNDAHPAGVSGPLDVRIARKSYRTAAGGRLDILHDIGFSLRRGEVGVLVGPSGCGKTTMLRIIAGIDRDYEGTVARPPAGRIGMVFQEPRLLPWRSVEDNVRLVAPAIADATLTMLFDVLELGAHRTHYPGELSLGLARRVALARAFAVEPDLLLLDEPFVSLDDALAARLREELTTLVATRSVTTLLVTHDVEEAARLGDRLFMLGERPTRVIAEIPISAPRARRSDAEIAAIRSEVVGRRQRAQ